MPSKPMYSSAWFDTFASRVPASATAQEVSAIARLAPVAVYPRLLDVGCGTGRVAGPLAAQGYCVVGIDTNVDALRTARRSAPDVQFVALDQRHVDRPRWIFDVAVVLWNSIGFGTRADDREILRGIGQVLRPGGRALFDLYHPDWLRTNEQTGVIDTRGATIDRWLEDGRSCHEIEYPDGSVDRIRFNVYRPEEIEALLTGAGFRVDSFLVWWKTDGSPAADVARYQVVSTRLNASAREWVESDRRDA